MSAFDIDNAVANCLNQNDFDGLKVLIQESKTYQEPFFIKHLPSLLEKLSDHKHGIVARECGELLISKMNPFGMQAYTTILYSGFSSLKLQTKVGALVLLGSFAKHQK